MSDYHQSATRPTQACSTDSLPCSLLSRPRAIVAPSILSSWPASHFRKKGTGSATGGSYGPALTMEPTIIHRVWSPATIKRSLSRACSTAGLLFLCYLFVASTLVDVVWSFHFGAVPTDITALVPAVTFRHRSSTLFTLHLPPSYSLRISHRITFLAAKRPSSENHTYISAPNIA